MPHYTKWNKDKLDKLRFLSHKKLSDAESNWGHCWKKFQIDLLKIIILKINKREFSLLFWKISWTYQESHIVRQLEILFRDSRDQLLLFVHPSEIKIAIPKVYFREHWPHFFSWWYAFIWPWSNIILQTWMWQVILQNKDSIIDNNCIKNNCMFFIQWFVCLC